MNGSSQIALLFTIPQLKLYLPGCDRTAYGDLGAFDFGDRQWELKYLRVQGNGYEVVSSYPVTEAERWNGAGLIVRAENDTDIDGIKKSVNEICWILSLWGGQYVTWKHLYRQECDSWKLRETAVTVESDKDVAVPAHALCAPNLFIERVEPYFRKNSSAFIYTINWLCRAFTCVYARAQSLILSMIYERLVSAVRYGKKRKKTTFGKRANYCREIAGGTYSKKLIALFINERNKVVHGSDNVTQPSNAYIAYLIDLTAVVYATTLALLGYEASFSVRGRQTNVRKLYKDVPKLATHPLYFKYK